MAWGGVGSRSWTGSLGEGWRWTVAGLGIAKRLQIVRGTLLAALSVLLRLALVRGATAEGIHGVETSPSSD